MRCYPASICLLLMALALPALALPAAAQQQPPAPRQIPAKTIPAPDTVSPEMRAMVAAPPAPWDIHPQNNKEWAELAAAGVARNKALLPGMRERLRVSLEPVTLGGVPAFILTPKEIAPENRNRVFLHFHGGAYVLNPGEVRNARRHADGGVRPRQGDLGGLPHRARASLSGGARRLRR